MPIVNSSITRKAFSKKKTESENQTLSFICVQNIVHKVQK